MKKLKRNIWLFTVLMFTAVLHAQTDYIQFETGTHISFPRVTCQEGLTYCAYRVNHKHAPVQLPLSPASIDTPEGLLSTLVSTNERTTLSAYIKEDNLLAKKQEMIAFLSQPDSLNYWLLDSKIELPIDGYQYVIMKYYHIKAGEIAGPYSLQMQQEKGRWIVVDEPQLYPYEDVLRQVKYRAFAKLLERGLSGDDMIDNFANQCLTVIGTIDINKLHTNLQEEISESTELARYIAEF